MRVVEVLIIAIGLGCRGGNRPGETQGTERAEAGPAVRGPQVTATNTDTAYLQPADTSYLRFLDTTGAKLLPGYRLPRRSDFKNYWRQARSFVYRTRDDDSATKAPFWTKGLFNSDDRVDFVYILVHKTSDKKSLFVFLSDTGGYRVVPLKEEFDEEMGLATQQPVKLSYYPTADAHPQTLDMKREGIAFFMFESASSVFVWDPATNAFKRYWISD